MKIDAFAYALLGAIIIGVICYTVRTIINRLCQSKERNTQVICGTVVAGLSTLARGDYEIKLEDDK